MEEPADERCSVVYFCASVEDDIQEVYHAKSGPDAIGDAKHDSAAIDGIYANARTLLDEDQGGFHEVFVSSQADKCLTRIEQYANTVPTIVLVELLNSPEDGSPLAASNQKSPFPFLRALSADIQGARYQRPVMPFALLAPTPPGADASLNAAITAACLSAGAVDIVHSPLEYEDINRLVGHVKDVIRPAARLVGSVMAQNLVDSIRNTADPRVSRHRPDESVPAHRKRAVEQAVREWHFPAHEFAMDELTYAAMFMLEDMLRVPELQAHTLPRAELMTFLLATRRQYKHEREVHYHNWRHAVDVMQSLYCFLLRDVHLTPQLSSEEADAKELSSVERLLTPMDGLILLVSALGHDVGHPGVNNAFLVACNHPLAQMYNDKSVLENYHCAAYSQLLRRHWPSLGNIPSFRSVMISTILATDMQRHFEYMSSLGDLKRKLEKSKPDLSDWSNKDRDSTRELVMALLMKAADISNVARPFDVSAHWARILMNEFSRQGELESELEIPTCLFGGPPNKEDILAAAQSQKGFMSLFGFPLFSGMHEVMPSVNCAITELENNKHIWDRKIEEEKQRRDSDGERAPLTFSSVTEDEVEEAKVRHHKSEPSAVATNGAHVPSSPAKRSPNIDPEVSPTKHAAHQHRQHLATGIATSGNERSSAPYLPGAALPIAATFGSPSRRSSKDVALDHMQQLNLHSQQSGPTGSRRGSADASWQIHQSYPNSRRGSKDESLTTILVTSGGSPTRRSSPSSAGRSPGLQGGSPGKHSTKRQSLSNSQKQAAARNSVPSSRSHTTSSATANTTQHSPSTQPSSLAATDDEPTPPAEHHASIAATEDPFLAPSDWPNDLDGTHRASAPDALPRTPLTLPGKNTKPDSPRIIAHLASGEEDDTGRGTPRKGERGIRESRSRSRLRGLKFWKKKRDVSGVEAGESYSP